MSGQNINSSLSSTLDLNDTLVAFFDIQGYSAFISQSKEEVIRKTKKLFGMTRNTANTNFGGVVFHSFVLSDSLVIVVDTSVRPVFLGSIHFLLATCSSILNEAINFSRLPLRGAIGAGWFHSEKDLIISSGLVDAATYERGQDWFGMVVTESAERLMLAEHDSPEHFLSKNDGFLNRGKIPWKSREQLDSRIISEREYYYVTPFGSVRDDPNFKLVLPDWFRKDTSKVKNSEPLYGCKIC